MEEQLQKSTEKTEAKKNQQLDFNVLDMLLTVGNVVKKSTLAEEKIKTAENEIARLMQYLGTTRDETILFTAVFILHFDHEGKDGDLDLKVLAGFFDCLTIQLLKFFNAFTSLEEKKLIKIYNGYSDFAFATGTFGVNDNISKCITENTPLKFGKEKPKNRYAFFCAIIALKNRHLEVGYDDDELILEIEKIENEFIHLPFIKDFRNIFSFSCDYFFLCKLCFCTLSGSITTCLNELLDNENIPSSEYVQIALEFKKGTHNLIKNGFVILEPDDFFANSTVKLTDKALNFFLGEEAFLYISNTSGKNIIKSTDINQKNLYFSDALQKEIDFLEQNLHQSAYTALTKRLKTNKMSRGIAALFYGDAGTGKTESVYQIARATGRDIFHVDISDTKSCWFGESEKEIKKVFDSYRTVCSRSKKKPILLFNEADAVFSKRKDSLSSNVAQTENAIQNIILEEIEKLDGILIATTNLQNNFDSAFERRFLFKIRFEKPDGYTMAKIWQNRLPYLNDSDCLYLAENFAFSGGEIENIVRKITMEEVLTGTKNGFAAIQNFCKNEKLNVKQMGIGFR